MSDDSTSRLNETDNTPSDSEETTLPALSRRVLLGLLGLSGLGVMSGAAGASHGGPHWRQDVDADGHDLFDLARLGMIDDPVIETTDTSPLDVRLTGQRVFHLEPVDDDALAPNIVGGHDSNGVAESVKGGTISGCGRAGTGFDEPNRVSGNFGSVGGGRGNTVAGDVGTVGGGEKNTAGGEHATVSGGVGNAATAETTSVGGGVGNEATTEDATVGGGARNSASGEAATVGGGQHNVADAGGATASGGTQNWAGDVGATVGGGNENRATDVGATVAGGRRNEATEDDATVAGGQNNTADEHGAAIGGGSNNRVEGFQATVPGGFENSASGAIATVGGGANNTASGRYSFAAGRQAKTETSGGTSHDGAVVFGDSSTVTVRSRRPDEFSVQAGGGAVIYSSSDLSTGVELPPGSGSWSSLSTRTAKTEVRPVDPAVVLDGVERLQISTWEYDSEADATHMGPMAEDFHAAFALGSSEKRIATVDADGVALAAIQGLSAKLDEVEREIETKADRIDDLEFENKQLGERLRAIEQRLARPKTGKSSSASADD